MKLGNFRFCFGSRVWSRRDTRGSVIASLNEHEKRKVVEAFKNRSATASDGRPRSGWRSDALRLREVSVEVRGPSGDVQTHAVPLVDVASNAIAFLHGAFLYSGSGITATLRTRDGEQMAVTGKVARCEHVSGRVHEVGVEIDHAIDPTMFGGPHAEKCSGACDAVPWDDIRRLSERLSRLAAEAKDAASAGKLVAALSRYKDDLMKH